MADIQNSSKYTKRLVNLKSERDPYISYWRQLSDFMLGHKGRFLSTERNGKIQRNLQRNNKILNNSARLASRTLASGMMAGITSPARPWFRLAPPDLDMLEFGPVKEWLHQVEKIMREVFNRSNTYNALHTLYSELGVFGTAPMGVFEDSTNVIHCQPYTIGSYALALGGRNEVDTFYREFEMSVGQLVKEYGIDNVSAATKRMWETGSSEQTVQCLYVSEPNDNRDMMNPTNKNMPFRAIHMEKQASDLDGFLRDSGNHEFPILAPRWEVVGQDPYGSSCPGMDALGDTKALQLEEKRKAQALDKVVNPPLQAPVSMTNVVDGGGFQPGEITFVNDLSHGGIKSVYEMRPDIRALSEDIMNNEFRVKRAFYEDLFLMLANTSRRQITAREIEEKHEEKLLMLGPVLERLHNELLDPLIDRTFAIMQRNQILPPPPPELNEANLRVEYISVLAQAQRLVAINGIDRLAGYVGNLAALYPSVKHKFNAEQSVDEYAEALGVSPKIVRTDDEVQELHDADQNQQLAAQMMESVGPMAQAAKAAKDASETEVGGGNAIDAVMEAAR